MTEYDSDSSGADDVETGVTLGYASKEPTGDDFSQLGGHASWLDSSSLPHGNLAKCRVCNGLLNTLFQLNGDLPDRYAGHERRLYLFGCKRKACRRKDGSIRGLRYSKIDAEVAAKASRQSKQSSKEDPASASKQSQNHAPALGNALFGVSGSSSGAPANPFASSAGSTASSNPFASSTGSTASSNPFAASGPTTPAKAASDLSQTFAEKARIGAETTPAAKNVQGPVEPWPEASSFPAPWPSYFIDADKEFLDPEPAAVPQQTRVEDVETEAGGSGSDEKTTFESTMDKTFQKFADRVGQNPEQVLRYEFGGQPLLYSKKDAVGKAWPRIPRCSKCGSQRQFELQLTPHAITELESEDDSFEGMDWGTIILAVCGNDCEGWTEEWVGVQWEELAKAA